MSLEPEHTAAHAHAQGHGEGHSIGRTHAVVAVVLGILTIIAFVAVGKGLLPTGLILPVLLFLALVQVCLQVLFYMRLRWDGAKFAVVFASGVGLAVLISVVASVLLLKY